MNTKPLWLVTIFFKVSDPTSTKIFLVDKEGKEEITRGYIDSDVAAFTAYDSRDLAQSTLELIHMASIVRVSFTQATQTPN